MRLGQVAEVCLEVGGPGRGTVAASRGGRAVKVADEQHASEGRVGERRRRGNARKVRAEHLCRGGPCTRVQSAAAGEASRSNTAPLTQAGWGAMWCGHVRVFHACAGFPCMLR